METSKELAESIARWVGQNVYAELNPAPMAFPTSWVVNVNELLDHIAEVTAIEKEQLGNWANTGE